MEEENSLQAVMCTYKHTYTQSQERNSQKPTDARKKGKNYPHNIITQLIFSTMNGEKSFALDHLRASKKAYNRKKSDLERIFPLSTFLRHLHIHARTRIHATFQL